jgi:hypothetical protein
MMAKPKIRAGKDCFRGIDSFIEEEQYAPEMYQSEQIIKGVFFFCVYCVLHLCDNLRQRMVLRLSLQ